MPERERKSQLRVYKYFGLPKATPSWLKRIMCILQDTV